MNQAELRENLRNDVIMKRNAAKKAARVRQLHRRKMIAITILGVAMFLLLSVLLGMFFLKSAQAAVREGEITYLSIQVKDGDSLTSIAASYGDTDVVSVSEYVSMVESMNSLQDDEIHAGEYLIVPVITELQ